MKLLKSWTSWLILANIIIFLLFQIISVILGEEKLLNLLALQPISIISGQKLWTLLTSIFIHANLFHLFVNMFSLYFVGKKLFNYGLFKSGGLEDIIGRKRFLSFYILAGLFASIFFSFLSGFLGYGYLGENIFGNPHILGVGASGAIFGFLGLLAVLMPNKRVYLIAGPLIALVLEAVLSNFIPISLQSILSLVISIYIFFCIFAIFVPNLSRWIIPINLSFWTLPFVAIIPLIVIDLIPGIDLPIGNMAHLGGLILGLVYGLYLKKRYPNKTQILSQMFSK